MAQRFIHSHRRRTCCIQLKLSDIGQQYWRGPKVKEGNQKQSIRQFQWFWLLLQSRMGWLALVLTKHAMCYFLLRVQYKGYIEGATTRLCIPAKKRAIRVMQLMVKKGWFHNDEKKETYRTTRTNQHQSWGQFFFFFFLQFLFMVSYGN